MFNTKRLTQTKPPCLFLLAELFNQNGTSPDVMIALGVRLIQALFFVVKSECNHRNRRG